MNKQMGFVLRSLLAGLAAMALCVPGRTVGAVEMSAEVEAALALCGRCATLTDEELPVAIEQVRTLVVKLESEHKPANKVWLFRLKRCGSFLDYRIEAAGRSEEKVPGK